MLKQIIAEQKDFQCNFYNPDCTTEPERISLTKDNILSVHRELGEILSAIPSKSWRAESKTYDVDHLKEEIIDALKFLLNVAIIWGMNETEIYDMFMRKTEIVKQRFEEEKHLINK